MKHVHIDQLKIHVRGLSPEAAQKAAAGLGEEVQRRLIKRAKDGAATPRNIGTLDAGSVHIDSRSDANDATRAMGKAIVTAIETKTR